MPRYLSGIQPSSAPHIGNYFGAIEQHLEAAKAAEPGESFFFIADFHALTTVHDRERLERQVKETAATYLALGLDVERAVFFRQSDVPEVQELTWLLACCSGKGLLERAHSYKDKVAKGIEASMGLFTYPMLMASDILIYDADLVPVGKDQVQHVEMCQDMAGHFNSRYGTTKEGEEPEQILKKPTWQLSRTPKVPGVDGGKMSSSQDNFIWIFEQGKALKKAVNRIVTDSRLPAEPKDPDEVNAFLILECFLDDAEAKDWRARMEAGGEGAPGYGDIKKAIMAKMDERFGDGREKFRAYLEDAGPAAEMEDVLQQGAQRARAVARATLARCYRACGLTPAAERLAREAR
jgi:tryptophanyl-tRNA synthetase